MELELIDHEADSETKGFFLGQVCSGFSLLLLSLITPSPAVSEGSPSLISQTTLFAFEGASD